MNKKFAHCCTELVSSCRLSGVYEWKKKAEFNLRLTFLRMPHTKRQSNLQVVTVVYSGRSSVHLSAYLRTEQILVLSVVFFLETYTVIFRANLIFVSIVRV